MNESEMNVCHSHKKLKLLFVGIGTLIVTFLLVFSLMHLFDKLPTPLCIEFRDILSIYFNVLRFLSHNIFVQVFYRAIATFFFASFLLLLLNCFIFIMLYRCLIEKCNSSLLPIVLIILICLIPAAFSQLEFLMCFFAWYYNIFYV